MKLRETVRRAVVVVVVGATVSMFRLLRSDPDEWKST
jgi:hypothetical protein